MKEKKTKNHKENWIGNIIRGFLLFMPLLAIGVTCAYAIFNKNAYQSYYGETINEESYELPTNIETNKNYTWISNQIPEGNIPLINYFVTDVQFITYSGDTTNYTELLSDTNFFRLYSSNDLPQLVFYDFNNNVLKQFDVKRYLLKFDFTYLGNSNSSGTTTYISPYTFITIYNKNSFIDNVFYYSIDKVEQSPLFNWSTDTGIYNVIHGACTTLGIESTFVPFLLAYWLLTYLIYIIYDIALLIVNMAHNRIHDVESSI